MELPMEALSALGVLASSPVAAVPLRISQQRPPSVAEGRRGAGIAEMMHGVRGVAKPIARENEGKWVGQVLADDERREVVLAVAEENWKG